eukprot:COSAG02_NODE_217_length_28595_cov_19.642371_11_plen_87_part_00
MSRTIEEKKWLVSITTLQMRRHRAKPIAALDVGKFKHDRHPRYNWHWHKKKQTSNSLQKTGSSKKKGRKKGKEAFEVVFANPLDGK